MEDGDDEEKHRSDRILCCRFRDRDCIYRSRRFCREHKPSCRYGPRSRSCRNACSRTTCTLNACTHRACIRNARTCTAYVRTACTRRASRLEACSRRARTRRARTRRACACIADVLKGCARIAHELNDCKSVMYSKCRNSWSRQWSKAAGLAGKSWRVETQARTFKPSSSHRKLAYLA